MGRVPQSRLTLTGELRKQRAQITNKGTLFEGTGIHFPEPGVVQVDGTMQVTGSLDVDGSATFGGDTTIGGNAAIVGTLSLPAGIIDNDALATPVVVGQAFQATSGFSLSVAGAYIITINQATPAGFTKVVVTAFGRVLGQNSTASGDSLYTDIDVNGAGGNQFPTGVGAGTGNTSSVGFTTTVTGLTTGATVSTKLFASTGAAGWAASGANAADLSVTYSWSR
jgi:hypothetical protein